MIIRRYLHPLKDKQIDTLILGCTHYPLLKPLIQARTGGKVSLIDSSIEVSHELEEQLLSVAGCNKESGPAKHRIYLSDITDSARRVASSIFGHPVELLSP
jgi:glutamate racemase